MFNIYNATCDVDMRMPMLIKLLITSIQGVEDINFNNLFECLLQHSTNNGAKHSIEYRRVIVEKGKRRWHSENNVSQSQLSKT